MQVCKKRVYRAPKQKTMQIICLEMYNRKKITLKQFKVPIKLFYDKYSELGMQWYPFQKV